MGAAASILLGVLSFDRRFEHAWWVWPLLAVETLVLFSLRRKKNRVPAVFWFAFTAFFPVVLEGSNHGPSWLAIAAGATRLAVCVLLMWPRQVPRREGAPLPIIPVSWAWLSTAIASFALVAVLMISQGEVRDPFFLGAFSLFLLFTSLAIGSQLRSGRWVVLFLALLVSASALAGLRTLELDTFREVCFIACPCAFVAAFDWLRAPLRAHQRFLRTALSVLVVVFLVPAIAAPHQAFTLNAIASALIWAVAFGVIVALTPRLAPRRFVGERALPWAPTRSRRLWMPIVVAVLLLGAAAYNLKPLPEAVIFLPIALGLACIRRRGAGNFAATMIFVLFLVCTFSGSNMRETIASGIPFGALLVGWFLARWAAAENAPSIFRRHRHAFPPALRASPALGAIALAAPLVALITTAIDNPGWRSAAISDLLGPVAINNASIFPAPMRVELSEQTGTPAGTVAIDPLGRGTWIVDEEKDQVALIADDGTRTSFKTGAWPEQLAVGISGRVFVSCRGSGTVFVVEPDLTTHAFAVGAEPRSLALDEARQRLYVGLMTPRMVVAANTETLGVVAQHALDVEPRIMASTWNGLAVLPGRGSEVIFLSDALEEERRVPLYANDRTAWHGQALVPVGRDLIVLHAAIDTGLSAPVSTGGYGGQVRQPIETVVAILHDGRPSIYPARDERRIWNAFDVTGAAWHKGQLYLASRGTKSITVLGFENNSPGGAGETVRGSGLAGLAIDEKGRVHALAAFERKLLIGEQRMPIGDGVLDVELALGRELFHAGNDERISSTGIPCATCHPDGRDDGLVWRLKGTLRQTPLLAGRVAGTAPFNWNGTTQTLKANIHQTIERLGGRGLPPDEMHALERYLVEGMRTPVRAPAQDQTIVAEGKHVFDDPAVGCTRCHDGARAYTDGFQYDVGATTQRELADMREVDARAESEEFDVPSLRYVGLSAPYFHNGSVPTLEEIVGRENLRMGDTRGLTDHERSALVEYLKTL